MSNVKKSFKKKLRTRAELDQAYNMAALQLGHKTRLLEHLKGEAQKLTEQCQEHLNELMKISKEEVAPVHQTEAKPEGLDSPIATAIKEEAQGGAA